MGTRRWSKVIHLEHRPDLVRERVLGLDCSYALSSLVMGLLRFLALLAGALFALLGLVVPALAQAGGDATTPSSLTGRVTGDGVELSWDAPADDAGSITSYEIQRRRLTEGGDLPQSVGFDTGEVATTHIDRVGLEADARYEYRVRAVRGGAKSPWSAPVQVAAGATTFFPFGDPLVLLTGNGDGGDGSGQRDFSRGAVHTWRDGDRPIRVVLQNDVDVREDVASSDTLARGARGVWDTLKRAADDPGDVQPVFRLESGAAP